MCRGRGIGRDGERGKRRTDAKMKSYRERITKSVRAILRGRDSEKEKYREKRKQNPSVS